MEPNFTINDVIQVVGNQTIEIASLRKLIGELQTQVTTLQQEQSTKGKAE